MLGNLTQKRPHKVWSYVMNPCLYIAAPEITSKTWLWRITQKVASIQPRKNTCWCLFAAKDFKYTWNICIKP